MKRYFGLLLFVIGAGILASVLYLRNNAAQQTRTFSSYTLLTSSWEKYKTRFINDDGRVIDYSQQSVTTSEGQSYAMLQAVWVDDKATFDKVWTWTKNTLKRPTDNLFGWRWGQQENGNYGFLESGGVNSASDADVDIALALILAHRRWRQQEYIDPVKPILNDIWNIETAELKGKRYLIAGNWANANDRLVINPSYFAPYAWRIFAQVDNDHDWTSLIDPAYDLLNQATTDQLDLNKSAGIPPDWISISKSDEKISSTDLPGLTTNYSFDAMRIPWRISLDYQWFQEPKAKEYLRKLTFFTSEYEQNQKIAGSFTHDGTPIYQNESPVMYATLLGKFLISNPELAETIYQTKIVKLYSNDTNAFRDDLPYYEKNWLWFGSALYANYLIPFDE